MFVQQERTAILILITVIVIVIGAHIVFSAAGKYPFASAYSDRSADGELVLLSGTIGDATMTKNGGHLILDINNVSVFVPADVAGTISYAKGQNITLYGTVQTYRGKKEIMVTSPGDIRLGP